ncbi:serine hydrolase domain-containing protein [Sphaerimonospora cavernae]|uniref:Serine hydrolase domain-containing protein n=1 Tax=Sphaerimonospora cavernae TaxID=1740611 RepID=A0ABV6U9U7_9ACTN
MSHSRTASPSTRRLLAAGALAASLTLAVGAGTAPAIAGTRDTQAVAQKELDKLVRSGEFPGALAQVRDRDGNIHDYTAGVGDVRTKAKVPVDGRVRIGSNTKTFVATVMLQLVGEGKVGLDAKVEKYLPKLIRGNGNDGRKITIRQLLQHTSGLPNYTRWIPDISKLQHLYSEPRELLDMALAHRRSFVPGKGWEYSNTNYVVAGLIVQKVTGRPISEEIDKRITDRLGLRDTYWPGIGDQTIRGTHPHGYTVKKPGAKPVDVTKLDPSWGWAAGQLIGSPGDLNRFYRALLDGKLLKPEQLRQMRETVKAKGLPDGWEYGLGLVRIRLSCGGYAWGHGGDIDGYETRNAATDDGRAAAIAVTALPSTEAGALRMVDSLDRILCAAS